MKRLIYITFCLFTGLCLWSCNNDFLDENKKELVAAAEEPIFIYNSDDPVQKLTISSSSVQNQKFTVWQYPSWIKFNTLESKFHSGTAELEFQLKIDFDFVGYQAGGIIILDIDGIGCVEFEIYYYNAGNPVINTYPENIDFGKNVLESEIYIQNSGYGELFWKIVSKPEWISFQNQPTEGIVSQNGNLVAFVSCVRGDLEPGTYTGEIVIESNSRGDSRLNDIFTSKIPVSMEVLPMINPGNVWPIEGTVTGAKFDKKRNLLFVTTSSPNELIVFNIKQIPPSGEGVLRRISLGSAPRCLSLSENGDHLFVGVGGELLQYDVSTMNLVKSIELDFIPFDVVYGENDWCYLSPDVNYSNNHVYCVNIKTGEIRIPQFGNSFGLSTRAYFTKTPGEAKILLTRSSVSPAGVLLFDISEPIPNEQTKTQYWHEDYGLRRPFWLSGNGDLLYTGDGSVLRNPAKRATGSDLMPIDKLPYSNIRWIDLCEVNNSIWGATRADESDSKVFRLNSSGYSQISSMEPSDHVATIDNVKKFYPTSAHYVFSNSTGTILFIVKNVNNRSFWSYDYINAWSMEYLEIK